MLNDFELTSVDVNKETPSLLNNKHGLHEESVYVNTRYGKVLVEIQGDQKKTPFVTYPDIGLTSSVQFNGFFNFSDNEPIMHSFCCYHINAPGQEIGAASFPTNYAYPTCDQLSETVLDVVNHFHLKSVICFGVGMGANILARFALQHENMVNGCCFINLTSSKCGWIEWGYQKWNKWYLSSGQYTEFTNNYLLWHHFGYQTWERNHDLIESYSRIFSRLNPINLSHLIHSYITRTDLAIERNDFEAQQNIQKFNFRCSVLNVMGDHSPHEDDVVDTNGRLNPSSSAFVKFADCGGMVLEEQPAKMAEALRHFLQGLGYVPGLSVTRHSISNRNSDLAMKQKEFLDKASHLDAESFGISSVNLDDAYKPLNQNYV